MAHYIFQLHDGKHPITAETWLADRECALEHAYDVVRELMRGRELATRSWQLDVHDKGECVHQVLFASVDETRDHLDPAEARACIARSRGKPYLATIGGKPTIRSSP